MKYVITGGTGNISRPLAMELLKRDHMVTVIGRNEERLGELASAGAYTAIGDLEDLNFLTETFKGAEAVYTMCPPNFMSTDLKGFYEKLGENYSTAIRSNNIKYVVNLSSIGADIEKDAGPVSGMRRAEQALNKLRGVNIKHLRAGYFYSNLLPAIPMIKYMGMVGNNFSVPEKQFPVADYSDIIAAALEELTNLDFTGQSIRYVVSDETDTSEIAANIGEAIGMPELRWMKFSNEQAMEGLLSNGVPQPIAREFIEVGSAIDGGNMYETYRQVYPRALGKIKVKDFAKSFASIYQSQSL